MKTDKEEQKQKRKAYFAKWYRANEERVKSKALANYYANREERLPKKRAYYHRKKMEGLLDATE